MVDPPPGLPAGFAEPLHILEPGEGAIWYWVALAIVLVAVSAVVVARRRRWSRERPSTPPTPRLEPTTIGDRIDEIEDQYQPAARRRDGCHQLSILLREQLEASQGQPFTRMTARESQKTLGSTAASQCLLLLSKLRFGRREPGSTSFETACELVRAVVGAARKTG